MSARNRLVAAGLALVVSLPVAVPAPLAVGANYGLTVLADAKPAATQFAQFVLSADGQRILARHGFDAP